MSLCGGESRCVESYVNGIDHKFVNLDLDPLDFKSKQTLFEKAIHRIKKMDLDLSVVVFTGT